MKTFKHSGDVGDLIYALPLMRCAGGGKLYLSSSEATRLRMSMSTLLNLGPLFILQPYIEEVAMWNDEPVDFDMDQFRIGLTTHANLASQHLATFGMPPTELEKPWIEVEPRSLAKVVINRTSRYHNTSFPWNQVVAKYQTEVLFVGHPEEHNAFVAEFGQVRYEPTPTLLELAQLIAGCALFVGNQSTPYALAEALKKPVVQEVYLETPNCIFPREGAQFVKDGVVSLPDI